MSEGISERQLANYSDERLSVFSYVTTLLRIGPCWARIYSEITVKVRTYDSLELPCLLAGNHVKAVEAIIINHKDGNTCTYGQLNIEW